MSIFMIYTSIAQNIKQKVKAIELEYLILGIIAGLYSEDILENELCSALTKFKNNYLKSLNILYKSDKKRSFLWGYYFYILSTMHIKKVLEEIHIEQSILNQELMSYDIEVYEQNSEACIELLNNIKSDIASFDSFNMREIFDLKKKLIINYSDDNNRKKIDILHLDRNIINNTLEECSKLCINELYNAII